MKKILNILSLTVLVAAVATWLLTGANRAWTKTSVPVKTLDPVTGIEGITYEPKFLPGVDFLGAAAGMAAVLAGSALIFRTNKTTKTNNQ